MPYVDQETRKRLLDVTNEEGVEGTPGVLAFMFAFSINDYLSERLQRNGELRFSDLGEVLTALAAVHADYVCRILGPYEERKRGENGDVWSPGVLAAVKATVE